MANDPRADSARAAVTMGIVADGHSPNRTRKPILRAPPGARMRLEAIRFALFLGRLT